MMDLNPIRIVLLALLLVGLLVHEVRSQAYLLHSLTGERALFRVSFNGTKEF